MTTGKKSKSSGLARSLLAGAAFARRFSRPLIGIFLLALLAIAARSLWRRIKAEVLVRGDYRLELHEIEITPLPTWIRGDLKAQALHDGSLDPPLSLLDEDLAERLAKAFSLHPWVAKVQRVAKFYPGRVVVDLDYRRPVAMVEVPGGLYPVDVAGVLLPSAEFSPLEARNYPRISGMESQPLGPTGAEWGDPAVASAALLAANLHESWQELKLYSIRHRPSGANTDSTIPDFQLLTRRGTVIGWGSPPGKEAAGEPSLPVKIARLKQLAREHGDLDAAAERQPLDLRAELGNPVTAKQSAVQTR